MRSMFLVVLAACGNHSATTADAPFGIGDDANGDAGVPFGTPDHTWTWVDLPGMTCGDGSPTGIGVNSAPESDDVLVFFEGGGACWDFNTCFVLKSAVHIEGGYGADTLQAELHYFPFDRTDPTHPLSAPTYVFVPYCTGDLHAGMRTATYVSNITKMVDHVGATNAQLVVDRVHAALPNAKHVWVVGQSAGGYGGTFDLHRFIGAWPTADVALLQDSSPFISIAANYGAWRSEWAMQFPPNCTTCTSDFTAIIGTVHANSPASRIGLLTFDNDTTIKLFFGYGALDSIVAATNAMIDKRYTDPTTHVFEIAGTTHTMLGGLATTVGPGGVHLADWVRQWASGDPAWTSAR